MLGGEDFTDLLLFEVLLLFGHFLPVDLDVLVDFPVVDLDDFVELVVDFEDFVDVPSLLLPLLFDDLEPVLLPLLLPVLLPLLLPVLLPLLLPVLLPLLLPVLLPLLLLPVLLPQESS